MENKNDCASYNSSLLKWLQRKCASISVSHLLDYTHLTKNTTTQWTQTIAIYIDIQSYIDYLGGGGQEDSKRIF